MNRIAAAAIIAAALALTGCAAITPNADAPTPSISETVTPTPEPTTNTEWFLQLVKEQWHGDAPTDQEILKYGAMGCQALRAGMKDVTVVEGTVDDAENNRQVVRNMTAACDDLYQFAGCLAPDVVPSGEPACPVEEK